MNPVDYIITSAKELVQLFPNTKVRYENEINSNTHIIEVIPNEVYNLNKDYQAWEEYKTFDFIRLFPTQNICFISDDAVVSIDAVAFEIKGSAFDLNYSINELCCKKIDKISVSQESGITTFPFDNVTNLSGIVFSEVSGFSFNISDQLINHSNIISSILNNDTVYENPNAFTYAIAA